MEKNHLLRQTESKLLGAQGDCRRRFERPIGLENLVKTMEVPEFEIRPELTTTKDQQLLRRLFAVANPRILYLPIPKCGCTYVKNVLWYINFQTYHSNPLRIHDDDSQFVRASELYSKTHSIVEEKTAFTVVRNPIDRFTSLYFDKIIGQGRARYVPLAQLLIDKYGLLEKPTALSEHQYNLEILAEWIQSNLGEARDMPSEAHWTPQIYRKNIMQEFNLKLLTVDQLKPGLIELLKRHVPQIDRILSASERNKSEQTVQKRLVLTDRVRKIINSVYREDRKLYRRTSGAWERAELGAIEGLTIPTFRDLFAK